MKPAILLLLVLACSAAGGAEDAAKKTGKSDFYAYHPDGSVKTRGVYQTNPKGQVVKYSVFDGAGNLLYTEVPYYADDGRIVRADHFDAQGRLEKVIVYFDGFLKVLDREGKLLEAGSFSQKEFLQSAK